MRLCGIVILALWPFHLWAQQAAIQTGEHADFTRVVVTIPPTADWRLGRNDQGYLLQVQGVDGYDLDRFFDLIPRRRILDARIGEESDLLQLVVACQCYVDAFVDRPNILVIDVRSGAAPANAQYEQPFDATGSFNTATRPEPTTRGRYSISENRLLPITTPRRSALQAIAPDIAGSSPSVLINNSAVLEDRSSEDIRAQNTDLQELERSITESLARGLSQGVLTPDIAQTGEVDVNASLQDVLPPGVEMRTGIDPAAIPPSERIERTQDGQVCPPDMFFDVGAWGDDMPFTDQIGRLRSRLVGEFDRFEDVSVLAKARLFVHFGFGREAIQTLQLDGVWSQERQYLAAIAQIIDEDPVRQGLFERLVSCRSDVALWALLATNDTALDAQVDPAPVLQAFKALPLPLQSHLGPRLSERFLAIGDEESALHALAPSVSDTQPTIDAKLAEAELLRDLGENEQATANLMQLARAESRITPDAMTVFFENAVRDNIALTAQDFALADALRFENAMTPAGQALEQAQFRAFLHTESFDAAERLMTEMESSTDPTDFAGMMNEYAVALTGYGDDMSFLTFAFDTTARDFEGSTAVAIANRLLNLGFPERSRDILALADEPAENPDAQYLQAEAALMMGDANAAMAALGGLNTARAATLADAAQAVARGVAFDREATVDETDRTRLWRRGDWTALSTMDDPLLRDVSNVILDDPLQVGQDAPLASGRALLEQSARSREILDRLLQRFQLPSES